MFSAAVFLTEISTLNREDDMDLMMLIQKEMYGNMATRCVTVISWSNMVDDVDPEGDVQLHIWQHG